MAIGLAGGALAIFGINEVVGGSRPPTPAAPDTAVRTGGAASLGLPGPVRPAFSPPAPQLLTGSKFVSAWATVRRPVVARASPSGAGRQLATLETRTPEGTSNVVLVVDRRRDERGRLWVRVRLPVLPNNTLGWVPRNALGGYAFVRTHLAIDLERLTATLHRNGKAVFTAPIGVGEAEWPTPQGEFYVRNKLTSYSSPFYGPLAFGTSARSPVLTDWPAGGFVGIHGTNRPDLIPGRISHGCIRLRNEDILDLGRLMPVGTPVSIG